MGPNPALAWGSNPDHAQLPRCLSRFVLGDKPYARSKIPSASNIALHLEKMSGFEIVGTSIAITCHLQSYLQKRSPFSSPDRRDSLQADSCLVELNTELALIHNTTVTTLAEIIDEDDLVELLGDLTGKTWKSPLVESKAKAALSDHYQHFWSQSLQFRVCLNGLCEIFDLRVPDSAEVSRFACLAPSKLVLAAYHTDRVLKIPIIL